MIINLTELEARVSVSALALMYFDVQNDPPGDDYDEQLKLALWQTMCKIYEAIDESAAQGESEPALKAVLERAGVLVRGPGEVAEPGS